MGKWLAVIVTLACVVACGSEMLKGDGGLDGSDRGDSSVDGAADAGMPSESGTDTGNCWSTPKEKNTGCGFSIPPLCDKAAHVCFPYLLVPCLRVPCECVQPDGAPPPCQCVLEDHDPCPPNTTTKCTSNGVFTIIECL